MAIAKTAQHLVLLHKKSVTALLAWVCVKRGSIRHLNPLLTHSGCDFAHVKSGFYFAAKPKLQNNFFWKKSEPPAVEVLYLVVIENFAFAPTGVHATNRAANAKVANQSTRNLNFNVCVIHQPKHYCTESNRAQTRF